MVRGRPGVVVEGSPAIEDTWSRGVADPRRMPDISQLVAAIESRLADIAAEISALDAAKAELSAPRSAVGAETLERLLADTSAGLSAKAIAAQAAP
jgi:hypothetical protein